MYSEIQPVERKHDVSAVFLSVTFELLASRENGCLAESRSDVSTGAECLMRRQKLYTVSTNKYN